LLVAFVWHLDATEPVQTYALTCKEALKIGAVMGWTRMNSWRKDGAYVTTQPSEKLLRLLAPHLMNRERWWGRLRQGTGMSTMADAEEAVEEAGDHYAHPVATPVAVETARRNYLPSTSSAGHC
jgi:hypothetical protein